MNKTALITGISGQDGSFLTELLLKKGYVVHGIIRRTSNFNTQRINHLYEDPHESSKMFLHYGDLTDGNSLIDIMTKSNPDEIYNLGAQSHVRVSYQNPVYTHDVVAMGTIRLLEAIRQTGRCSKVRFYQASSSEMFGKSPAPQCEETPFMPRSPYACAKVCGFHQTVNYREAYGLFACNGILFNHETNTPETPVLIRSKDVVNVVALDEISPKDTNSIINSPDIEIWDNGEWTKILHISRYRENKKIRRVLSRSGYVECTVGHKICGLEEDKPIELLECGEKVAPVILPNHNGVQEHSCALAWVVGFFVGDGSLHGFHGRRRTGKLHFYNKNTNYLNIIENNIRQIDQDATFDYSPYESGYKPGTYNTRLEVRSEKLKELLEDCYYEKKPKALKRIPKWVFNSKIDIIESFLDGYCAADGTKALPKTKYKFQYYTTISQVLAAGLKLLCQWTGRVVTYSCERRENPTKIAFYHKGFIRSRREEQLDGQRGKSGHNLMKNPLEITKIWEDYADEFITITTCSGKYSAGTGLIRIYNSPRRGENFVTRKITRAATRIKLGLQDKLYLGNLNAKRDWGYAGDYVEAMWLMLQCDEPDDYVVATGETHTVQEFVKEVFGLLELDWSQYVRIDDRYKRPAEVDVLQGDASKAKTLLEWKPKVTFKALVKLMVEADMKLANDELKLRG